ncbi:hypothetical protein H112_03341 [Trichophyton rubrum D6]|uniref:Uncharacterized protein n=3 Tax=Trichophyton TaxID=5550 RepID=F2SS98_TRIRC|nr:uncharacterized protein TERG_08883 [Trichophyton rubrum CBS 118892]EZF53777.1 hypothetical protein H103_03352 [Trichophyton rubrum CBS 288.86]EZF74987.1 hypothetical protein H105_03358 [Trichophyton soudanense CBS 452.61]EZF85693.1 hypothetical protein H110_03346 [Trichophyton rubrum MR1448]EZF96466.1 hypothetical protein H113_03356 [Trichophyton rubrum MR1459]EZG07401.1 hypothetical protein H106_03189 [Trichophyton rubrum CBS 735.88]KDB34899.1 hypothetical protein H112_03341 [Trichophyton
MVWRSNQGPIPVLAVEIGFPELSLDLEKRVKEALKKSEANIDIIFDIKEFPSYKNPLRNSQFIETSKAASKANTEELRVLSYQYCKERAPVSPVMFYDIQWMGELTAAVQVFDIFFGHPQPAIGVEQPEAACYDPYPNLKTKSADCVDSKEGIYNADLALD